MVAAGLLAKKAVEKGLTVPPHVKTASPPARASSPTTSRKPASTRPRKGRLLHRGLRLHTLHRQQRPASRADFRGSQEKRLRRRGVLSATVTSKGRINPDVKANYLASPRLLLPMPSPARRHRLETQPIGAGAKALPVYLRDIWPTHAEVQGVVDTCVLPGCSKNNIGDVWNRTPNGTTSNQRRRALRLECRQHLHSGAAVPR